MRNTPLILLALSLTLSCTADKTDDSAADDSADTGEAPPTLCETLGLTEQAFQEVTELPTHRRELAADFSIPLVDGGRFNFAESWTGCDATVFIPDYLPLSDLNRDSVWTTSVGDLVEASPRNARYVFMPFTTGRDAANAAAEAMQTRVDEYLTTLSEEDAAWWSDRLLVVSGPARDVSDWVGTMAGTDMGAYGFSIDRFQRVRGMGSLAAVEAYSQELSNAGAWPWERRLYPAAREIEYFNFEATRQAALDEVDATVVQVFGGDVIQEYEDTDVVLPDAATIATFDTLEIDVIMECPDTEGTELGNCGAWDYLAHMWIQNPEDESWMEMARFITTYHRESRWVVDASHALAWMQDGGTRHVRYQWAPSWNVQPTGVTLEFRFSNQGKGSRPQEIIPLFTGGGFNSAYNDTREPVQIDVPSDAVKVEFVAITTGHGADTYSCAEFCNHQHEFTLAGTPYLQEFPGAGTESGCAEDVGLGVVPNQAGTWWFGRGGWCPGHRVDPYKVDITADAAPGSSIEASYRGLFNNGTPPDSAGNVELRSWMVIWK